MSGITVVVGAQWGDEGKGKWVDIFAAQKDFVVRYQGGNNAGHTLYVEGEKIVLHQIPSGIFQNKIGVLVAGVVVNPSEIVTEIEKVRHIVDLTPENLWLSARSHVITPWQIALDGNKEASLKSPIGTTKRGIGPTYESKASRTGLRLGEFIDTESRMAWVEQMKESSSEFRSHYAVNSGPWEEFHYAAELIEKYVCDAEAKLRRELKAGKSMLLEGAQGALLDINHGTFPFVTSSSTTVGGAVSSLGFSAKKVEITYGVAKAYLTRVGEGPFPTELDDEAGKHMAEKGHEFGATTGRPRRCGWLDLVSLKYSYEVNGFDGIILNKFDILFGLKELKLCTAYEHPKLGKITDFPWSTKILSECKPVYESYEGFDGDIDKITSYEQLPDAAKKYIKAIEKYIDGRVTMVGTGVNRSDAIFID